jgi:hypothetical protein
MEQSYFNKLSHEFESDVVNWNTVSRFISGLGDAINEKFGEDDTLLSALSPECDLKRHGDRLAKLTKLFLDNGYDVNGNDGFNGGICLHGLCWADYRGDILEAAEMLLDAGADPDFSWESYENDGVLSSINFKLSYWTEGYYSQANLFEAYRRMIAAAQGGHDYHGIRSYDCCLGKRITRIEKIAFSEEAARYNAGAVENYKDALIVWCGSIPLVINQQVELFVDPHFSADAVAAADVSGSFPSAIGATIKNFTFIDSSMTGLDLSNGRVLLIGGRRSSSNSSDYFCSVTIVAKERRPTLQPGPDALRLYVRSGHVYSSTCDSFDERSIFIISKSNTYVLYPSELVDGGHVIGCQEIPKSWRTELKRAVELNPMYYNTAICDALGEMTGMEFSCGGKWLYLLSEDNNVIDLVLRSVRITDFSVSHCILENSNL